MLVAGDVEGLHGPLGQEPAVLAPFGHARATESTQPPPFRVASILLTRSSATVRTDAG